MKYHKDSTGPIILIHYQISFICSIIIHGVFNIGLLQPILRVTPLLFRPQLSQSLYERRSLEEMRKLQSYIEFLDFGENGFQRNKAELPSGLKNIGNSKIGAIQPATSTYLYNFCTTSIP